MTKHRPSKVYIDQAAYQHNLARVAEFCPKAKIMAVIKADAYGHGVSLAASALQQANEFAITDFDEAVRLRQLGVKQPITLLSDNLSAEQLGQLKGQHIRPTFFHMQQLEAFASLADNSDLSIWLKVDTGMGRLGIMPEQLEQTLSALKQIKGIANISLMSHFANADETAHPLNQQQIKQFKELCGIHSWHQTSLLNSAGVINFSELAGDIVRPGIMLFGISPIAGKSGQQLGLRPVMNFKSEIISIKNLPAGSKIGYGSTTELTQDADVAVIACGYADGYPRHAKVGTPVLINQQKASLIGRVSMDMITVDLNGIDARVGDKALLWGEGNPIEVVAEAADTIAYQLSCGILPRIERVAM